MVIRAPSSFRLCGYVGFVAAAALASYLALDRALSLAVVAVLAVTAAATFFGLAMATKVVTGAESLTYYHHQIAVLAASVLVLRWVHAPLLPYLDVVAVGLGVFLACGRIGCFLEGCCFGAPFPHGHRYAAGHVDRGLPPHLVGVRLFPVQAIESVWVLVIVSVEILVVLRGDRPGAALAGYLILYAAGRYFLEFVRGGIDRHFFAGFSEAQWTSGLVIALVLFLEAAGVLPRQPWHALPVATVALATVVLLAHPDLRLLHRLSAPGHLLEFAQAIDLVSRLSVRHDGKLHLAATRMGIQVSAGMASRGGTLFRHFTLSHSARPLTASAARFLAIRIFQFTRALRYHTISGQSPGILHVCIEASPAAPPESLHEKPQLPVISRP